MAINCAARECIYSQHLLMEACTEDALSNFMQANGAALTSALAPFLKGRGGLEVASRMLRSAPLTSWQSPRLKLPGIIVRFWMNLV